MRANVRRAISSNWASATGGPRDVFISGSWSITKRLKSAPHERETCRDRGVQTGAETGALRDKKKDRGRREMVEDKEEKRSEIGTQRLHINLRCYPRQNVLIRIGSFQSNSTAHVTRYRLAALIQPISVLLYRPIERRETSLYISLYLSLLWQSAKFARSKRTLRNESENTSVSSIYRDHE